MRKIMIVIFVLAAILVFSSVRDELLKTRENVRKEIEGTREKMFVETKEKEREEKNDEKEKNGDIINLTKCCDQDGDWVVFILFDPEQLADFLKKNCEDNSLDIAFFLDFGNCIYSGGRYSKDLGEIYDYESSSKPPPWKDKTIKEFAGFVLASSTEVTLTVESSGLKLENGDSVIGFEKNVLFDIVGYKKGSGKKIRDILTSLPTTTRYYGNYVREIDYKKKNEEWVSNMDMTEDSTGVIIPTVFLRKLLKELLEEYQLPCEPLEKPFYLWIYTWWLDLYVPEDTKAGRYSGEIVITISPKNVLQGG